MLEILFVYFLCKQVGLKVRAKSHPAMRYQVMLVALWLAGELGGAVLGASIFRTAGAIYLCALVGAAAGTYGAFAIINQLKSPADVERSHGFPVGPRRGEYP